MLHDKQCLQVHCEMNGESIMLYERCTMRIIFVSCGEEFLCVLVNSETRVLRNKWETLVLQNIQ